ncbi:hypothetical protein CspeluHIS016_0504590 [Cutaneotrichosporon spelunceum]|uniref:WH1-domain-containing protein n=1 Tax=Cutaneotrichosporon spelunceum TaxID=1672016 RepID=A0AAD3TX00_9TREE|nr:hypothetical protein CspeluHIS016_0504590 [Cutaneotrichosporon spelunceum]
MAPSGLLSQEDKAKVKKAIPASSSTNKIITAAVARVYYAKPNSWNYGGATGALAFVADKAKGGLWFRVVDLSSDRGVIWEHELPNEIEYNTDKPFFHTWESEDATIAFVFASEHEAHELYKKVANRSKYAHKVNRRDDGQGGDKEKKSFAQRIKGRLDKSLISGPKDGSFKHVAHMGFDSEKGFTSSGVDPSWQILLEQLSMRGVSEADIKNNENFIKDYVESQGGIENALAMTAAQPIPGQPKPKRGPPPPPTSRRKPAPSAPPPRAPPSEAPAPTPPAPPPARQVPVPTPSPPPPPAPPVRLATPVAAPPPSTTTTSAPSPSGPLDTLCAASASTPSPPGGVLPQPLHPLRLHPLLPDAVLPRHLLRLRLLHPLDVALRPPLLRHRPRLQPQLQPPPLFHRPTGQSVHKLKKVDDSDKRISPMAAGGAAVAGVAGGAALASAASPQDGGGLASSLAAALAQRKQDLGDSDEEDESDSDWD